MLRTEVLLFVVHRLESAIAQNGHTKHWLYRGPLPVFTFYFSSRGDRGQGVISSLHSANTHPQMPLNPAY